MFETLFCYLDMIEIVKIIFLISIYSAVKLKIWHSFFGWWNIGLVIYNSLTLEKSWSFWVLADAINVLNVSYMPIIVYRQRLFHNNNLELYEFLVELKFKLQIEHFICNSSLYSKFEKYTFVYDQLRYLHYYPCIVILYVLR